MRYPDLESLEFALLAFPHRPNCFPWTATELHRLVCNCTLSFFHFHHSYWFMCSYFFLRFLSFQSRDFVTLTYYQLSLFTWKLQLTRLLATVLLLRFQRNAGLASSTKPAEKVDLYSPSLFQFLSPLFRFKGEDWETRESL